MIGIFYGSTTGCTEEVANSIAQQLGVDAADIHNVENMNKLSSDYLTMQNYKDFMRIKNASNP